MLGFDHVLIFIRLYNNLYNIDYADEQYKVNRSRTLTMRIHPIQNTPSGKIHILSLNIQYKIINLTINLTNDDVIGVKMS